jgi:hypothetical protein
MKRLFLSSVLLVLLAACRQVPGGGTKQPETIPSFYEPRAGDEALVRDEVSIEWQELSFSETDPQQAQLHLEGDLPDSCHELRAIIRVPDEEDFINVEFYAVANPDQSCDPEPEPYIAYLLLGT